MSSFVCEAGSRMRVTAKYKAVGSGQGDPGSGTVCTITDEGGTTTLTPSVQSSGAGATAIRYADQVMPANGPYGVWWVVWGPGATIVGTGDDWFTVSPPRG